MVGQMALDSLGGINWESPRLEQLEQFALDCVPGCKTRWESHSSNMSICIERNGAVAWLRPSLERTPDDRLEWVVFLELPDLHAFVVRSDEGLEEELAEVFGGEA